MFHFCSHAWEVRDLDDGTLVRLTQRDLDAETMTQLVDDLFEVVQESGRPNLSLDFAAVHILASVTVGKLIALNTRLQEHGGRLTLMNLEPVMMQTLQAINLTDVFDIRAKNPAYSAS